MARAPKSAAPKTANGAKAGDKAAKPSSAIVSRDRVVDALLALAAEERFEEISLGAIAARADVTLAEFRDLFASKQAVLAAFLQRIDHVVLEGTTDDLADENSKERLFDVLMRRLDAMAPYKAGVQGIAEAARREPLLAARLNRLGLRSMRFMLEAAGIEATGGVGALKLQGLVIAWTRVVSIWLDDEDEGLAATMAELDRQLRLGDSLIARAKDVERLTSPLRILARSAISAGLRLATEARRKRRAPEGESAEA